MTEVDLEEKILNYLRGFSGPQDVNDIARVFNTPFKAIERLACQGKVKILTRTFCPETHLLYSCNKLQVMTNSLYCSDCDLEYGSNSFYTKSWVAAVRGQSDPIVQLHAQNTWHDPAIVAMNTTGLTALIEALTALREIKPNPTKTRMNMVKVDASDGESYLLHLILLDDDNHPNWSRLGVPYTDKDARDIGASPFDLLPVNSDAL